MKSQDKEEIIPYATLEKWSRLAERLKGKLEETKRENEELKERLARKSVEYDDLREAHAFQIERIDDLEFQCLEKSAKISNLNDLLETKGNSSEIQEKLLSKSLEHAELSLSVDRLRLALQKAESANKKLQEEKETLTTVNEELSKKLEDYATAWERSSREQERNRKLLLEMGDVVRTLNRITIDFEKKSSDWDGEDSAHQFPLQNIKRKIQAMEEDRQRLMKECQWLREENDSNHLRIQELESQFLSYSSGHSSDSTDVRPAVTTKGPVDSTIATQTSPVSIRTEILDQVDSATYGNEEQLDNPEDMTASEESSFSDLEPPTVPFHEHQTLKQYYEEALERIVRISAELGKAKASLQGVYEKDSYIDELKERLEQMKLERDDACRENAALEKQVQDALDLAEQAARKNDDLNAAHRLQIEEHKKKYQALKEKYNNLEKQYSDQIEELEKQVAETEKFFQVKCEGLKQQHLDKMEAAFKEKEELEKKHSEALKIERTKLEGINDEFDVFMEMHNELEDELNGLKKKYDEALGTIVDLEDAIKATNDRGEAEKAKLEKRIEEQTKVIKELKANLEKSKEEVQDAVTQIQNLRRENDNVLAKHGDLVLQLNKCKEQKQEDDTVIKGLKDNCYDMECRFKRLESDSSTRYMQIQISYQMAMAKVSTLVTQLHSVGLPIGDSAENPTNKETLAAHERIRLLELQLMGEDVSKIPSAIAVDPDTYRFYKDYCDILHHLNKGRQGQGKRKLKNIQPGWYYRLVHQVKTARLHEMLAKHHGQALVTFSSDGEWPIMDFLHHQTQLRSVHKALVESISLSFDKEKTNNQQKSPTRSNVPYDTDNDVGAALLAHRRRIKIVHSDVLSRSPLHSTTHGDSNTAKNPSDIQQQKTSETPSSTMAANTAKIRHEAREKEHRLVQMQYHKLLEQYNQAMKEHNKDSAAALDDSLGSPQKVKFAVQRIQKEAELKRLQSELRTAELKVERMASALRASKSKAEEAQKQQEEETARVRQDEREQEEQQQRQQQELELDLSVKSILTGSQDSDEATVSQVLRSMEASSSFVDEGRETEGDSSHHPELESVKSSESSLGTSLGGDSPSAERRDERCDRTTKGGGTGGGGGSDTVPFAGGVGKYLQLQQEYDDALRTIEQLRMELTVAERAAFQAREQVKQREEDLRDVIREYNNVKAEAESLSAQVQQHLRDKEVLAEGGHSRAAADTQGKDDDDDDYDDNDDDDDENHIESPQFEEDLIRERNVALGKISILESELEKAVAAAKAARKKQYIREDHLRQVIDQYKQLEQEHQTTKAQVDELQKALAQYSSSPPMIPSLETRQRSQESDEDKRETTSSSGGEARRERMHVNFQTTNDTTMGGEKSHDMFFKSMLKKTTRKAWFRDLQLGGHAKRPSQENVRYR